MDVTRTLARYLVGSRWEDIPERVRHEAARALLNFMGCAIGASRYEYAQIMIPAGAHHVTSMDAPFGITVSGLGSFTSYLYVGGLNLNEIPAPQ